MPSADDDAAHVLRIGGMTCGHCVGAVTSALEGVAGVARADVDLERGLATVAAAPGASLALADLVDAVEASGFDASDAAGGGGAATTQTLAAVDVSVQDGTAAVAGAADPAALAGAVRAAGYHLAGDAPGAAKKRRGDTKDGDDATWSVVELRVEGMTCAACASRAGYASSPDTARVEAEGEKAASDDRASRRRRFATRGMICPSCPPRIQRALKRLDGVRDVTVFLVLDAVELGYDASVQADDDGVDVAGERARKLARVAESNALAGRSRYLAVEALGSLLLAAPVQFVPASVLVGAFNSLRYGTANMDVLVALGTSAAYFYSIYVLYEFMEAKAKGRVALQALLSLQPKMATVSHTMDDGGDYEEVVDAGSLSRGDVVKIKPGEAVPLTAPVVAAVSAVVFDKTGTLTRGQPDVSSVDVFATSSAQKASLAASLGVADDGDGDALADALLDAVGVAEGGSEHPLASALVATAAEARGRRGWQGQRFSVVAFASSAGVSAALRARTTPRRRSSCSTWARGTSSPRPAAAAALSGERGAPPRPSRPDGATVRPSTRPSAAGASSPTTSGRRRRSRRRRVGDVVGMIGVADIIRDEAAPSHLQSNLGIEVWMLTGDNERTAQAIARQCGISRVLAKVRPDDKART
ncbi:cation-transporting ATPase [Aureococcus anophagefferens]|nr:cation-transporting ATPase [Aureococcus anophagefferens]